MQEKTATLNTTLKSLGLKINESKTKILRLKTNNNRLVMVKGKELEDFDSFIYLRSTINKEERVEEDLKKRIQKARQAFSGLKKIWSSKFIKERTKIKIFNSNLKAVLLYGAETWRTNKTTLQKLQSFIVKVCLRQASLVR
ncbi:hypothetical protein ElyMa_000117100 [Elysia marginata]|uniref:DUF6451 domain-containing protein n=1 Tax=Elysia marginata TaxID=1093978 RepID=A0AAV4ELN8_9GAST|nr:hypothetical protein ElyMa_000117100 [Elysia marginata]